jgi:3-deoxy-D-manno-octulosonate 8-phosphate phosphatase (KDO 8-P phosphatase)
VQEKRLNLQVSFPKFSKFSQIDLLVLDVDGVLTDGKIILSPRGEETKAFHVRDGSGMKIWHRVGKKMAIITGRASPAVEIRAKNLDVDSLRLNAKMKLPVYREVLSELGISSDRVAVVGDDLPDIPLMRHCAFPIAVADAVKEARDMAAYVTHAPGGCGAVREVIEMILKGSGLWEQVMERYLDDDIQES